MPKSQQHENFTRENPRSLKPLAQLLQLLEFNCVRLRLLSKKSPMQVTQLALGNVSCTVTAGPEKSPVNISIYPRTPSKSRRFGTFVYAVPQKSSPAATTLIANREFDEQSTLLAKLACSKLQRPVFLSLSVEASMLFSKSLIDAVEATISEQFH